MPTKLSLSLAVLIALGVLSGCHQVTIVSFKVKGADTPPPIETLFVDAAPQKSAVALRGLNETVGFYDLLPPFMIRTTGCLAGKVNLYNDEMYDAIVDRLTVELSPVDDGRPCPTRSDSGGLNYGMGGMGGQTVPGTGGAAGSPDDGGQGGVAGTSGVGGGSPGTGGSPGMGGMPGSDGGVDGVGGECDDGGVHDGGPDLGVCAPPTGDPAPGDVPAVSITQNCIDYCSMVFGAALTCPDLYKDTTQCQRYCTLAAWPLGLPVNDGTDSIKCREKFIGRAGDQTGVGRAMACDSAGAVGSDPSACQNSDGVCGKFCRAWVGICGGDPNACIATCADAPSSKVTCRAPWLLLAASDKRYCRLIDPVVPSCLVPGC